MLTHQKHPHPPAHPNFTTTGPEFLGVFLVTKGWRACLRHTLWAGGLGENLELPLGEASWCRLPQPMYSRGRSPVSFHHIPTLPVNSSFV